LSKGWNITCEGLTVRYKTGESQTTALREFNGSFTPGKITVVFGPSGSGKTTLLKATATLLKPTKGWVRYDRKNPYELPKKELLALRREIGISFQQPVFVFQLTLWENVELALNSSGKLDDEHREIAVHLAKRLGIKKLLSKKPHEVSGGELRRASIVMALAKDPSIVILDEPTAYLDEESSKQVVEILRGLRNEGKTVVVSTHDPELIGIADVTYRLRYGRVVESTRIS